MKKWLRRLLYLVAFVLIGLIVTAFVVNAMSRAMPEWYHPARLSEAQIKVLANQATQKLLGVADQVSTWHAQEVRRPKTAPAGQANTRPADALDLAMTDDELNAFFQDWAKLTHWDQKMARYVADPQIQLQDGQLILAARLVGVTLLNDRVVHAHFRPELDTGGRLNMKLVDLRLGKLPLPQAIWDSQKRRLLAAMDGQLPALRRQARLTPTGVMNSQGVAAAMGQLLLDVANDRPGEPVLFVPVSNGEGGVPVKLTGLKIESQTLKLTAVPMPAPARQAFLAQLRQPQPAGGVETQP